MVVALSTAVATTFFCGIHAAAACEGTRRPAGAFITLIGRLEATSDRLSEVERYRAWLPASSLEGYRKLIAYQNQLLTHLKESMAIPVAQLGQMINELEWHVEAARSHRTCVANPTKPAPVPTPPAVPAAHQPQFAMSRLDRRLRATNTERPAFCRYLLKATSACAFFTVTQATTLPGALLAPLINAKRRTTVTSFCRKSREAEAVLSPLAGESMRRRRGHFLVTRTSLTKLLRSSAECSAPLTLKK